MITVKKDCAIVFPTIEMPLYSESKDNDPYGGTDSNTLIQTKTDGIAYPIVRIDDFIIAGPQMYNMELKIRRVPQITFSFDDTFGFLKAIGTPSPDTRMQLQIIPPFDNAYKKINMLFRITKCDISGTFVTIRATYFVDNLYNNVRKQYGEETTYNVFSQIADDLKLGFASNVENTNDARWMFNPNKQPVEYMDEECQFAGNKDGVGNEVYEFWIDYFNNINLVNVLQECTSKEIKKIWIQPTKYNSTDEDKPIEPIRFEAVITNHSTLDVSPLSTSEYRTITSPAEQSDTYFECMTLKDREMNNVYIADDSVQKNVFVKSIYGGEFNGDYDYLSQQCCQSALLAKLRSNRIEVSVDMPLFALQRGDRVKFNWFETQSLMDNELKKQEGDTSLNSDYGDTEEILNQNISGVYYIDSSTITYDGPGQWQNTFVLIKTFDR